MTLGINKSTVHYRYCIDNYPFNVDNVKLADEFLSDCFPICTLLNKQPYLNVFLLSVLRSKVYIILSGYVNNKHIFSEIVDKTCTLICDCMDVVF